VKILWVKSGGLVPLDTGGKIRSYCLLRELSKLHTVDLFTFYAAHEGDAHPELSKIFHRVICQPLPIAPPHGFGDFAHYLRNLLSLRPYSAAKYCRPEVVRNLRGWLQKEKYDLILCDFLLTAEVIPWDLPGPKVIFTHNVEAQIWERHYLVSTNPVWRVVSWREYKTMSRMERRYLLRADLVLTVSENDSTFFSSFVPSAKLCVVPTGVDIDYFQPVDGPEQPNSMVFTGSMDWMPNEDAIFYFVEDILPRIQVAIPDVLLSVVGRNPSVRLRALARQNQALRVTGTVEDIRPFVHPASVYLVPLRIGGGTRIKIYEAMAMGKAVVSTRIGAEGLPVQHGKHILLSDEPAEFAESVVWLLRNPAQRRVLGEAARELVERNYSWRTVALGLGETLAHVAEQCRPADPSRARLTP